MKITVAMLREHHACAGQVALFEQLFGQSTTVTLRKCVAVAELFDWDWAAAHLLPAAAWKAYRDVKAPARKSYLDVMGTARKSYFDMMGPAVEKEVMAPAEKAYRDATVAAWKTYDEVRAAAFARAANLKG